MMKGLRVYYLALGERYLYDRVRLSRPEALRTFRASLESRGRAQRVREFWFDRDDYFSLSSSTVDDLMAILRQLSGLVAFRANFNSYETDALSFWAQKAYAFSPTLEILRLGDTTIVSALVMEHLLVC